MTIQPATAVEGMFTCHVNNESVSVGIYYPSKLHNRYTAAALCLLLIKKMYQIYRRHIKMI